MLGNISQLMMLRGLVYKDQTLFSVHSSDLYNSQVFSSVAIYN